MAKVFGKYFIAIVPKGEIQKEANLIKEALKERFGLKYALKSPPHVTLKMPFSWNEAKELDLINKLEDFLKGQEAFNLSFDGFGRFGSRVIYIKVKANKKLLNLQAAISDFCKKDLKLVKELSDTNYTPHMTVAFKDIKSKHFDDYWSYIKGEKFRIKQEVNSIAVLKRVDGKWSVLHQLKLEE